MKKLQRLNHLNYCQKNQKPATRLHLMVGGTDMLNKLQPWKNTLIFYHHSQFPSISKKFKWSKWDLPVAAAGSPAWRRQNPQPLGGSRLAVRLQCAANRGLLNIAWKLWMGGSPGNDGLVPCGAVGKEEIKELFLWGSYISAGCFTFVDLPIFASCRSPVLSAIGQLNLWQLAKCIFSLKIALDFKLLHVT